MIHDCLGVPTWPSQRSELWRRERWAVLYPRCHSILI
jgi:hypothetical protein